ncbi:hypothetical protein TcasGA2_TC015741 [Tribolium castaneum]|uniref:Uncharacterized protein n=1 Tax=Tribolium castaneum TaxID=7070 RepID=D2A3R5_TRICA|nr:hypothetical protein TcasGA2_TC015741 [Tribolium castaneum]
MSYSTVCVLNTLYIISVFQVKVDYFRKLQGPARILRAPINKSMTGYTVKVRHSPSRNLAPSGSWGLIYGRKLRFSSMSYGIEGTDGALRVIDVQMFANLIYFRRVRSSVELIKSLTFYVSPIDYFRKMNLKISLNPQEGFKKYKSSSLMLLKRSIYSNKRNELNNLAKESSEISLLDQNDSME